MRGDVFLDRDDPELAAAWAQFLDPAAESGGERWQYVGTEPGGGTWRHVFRHRDVLGSGESAYVRVPASDGWRPEQGRGRALKKGGRG